MRIALTRDSVAAGDDCAAPNPGSITVPDDADAVMIGEAILTARYLPSVHTGSTWHVAIDGAFLVLSDRPGQPALSLVGTPRRIAPVTELYLCYDLQREPSVVTAALSAPGENR